MPSIFGTRCLCEDILRAFSQLESKLEEAKKLKVFEPNDVGLVRVPRYVWLFVMGTEAKMAEPRSRLYVEKYRTRVLIKPVCWKGLREIEGGVTKGTEIRGVEGN
jgi:hypothetical protein